jgi:hypothetical protein
LSLASATPNPQSQPGYPGHACRYINTKFSIIEALIAAQAHGWRLHQWAAGVLQAAATAIQRKLTPTRAHSNGLEVQKAPAKEQNEGTQICTATS